MKKTLQLLSFLMVICMLLCSCAQSLGGLIDTIESLFVVENNENNGTSGTQTPNAPSVPSVNGTNGQQNTEGLSASQSSNIKDQDGNLLVPFDVAYPEVFASGEAEYNSDLLLLKLAENFGGAITKELQDCGFSSLEKFLNTKNGDWYRAYLAEGVDIAEAMKEARSLDAVLMADYDYVYVTEAIDYDSAVSSIEDGDPFICKDEVKENKYWKDMYHLDKNQVQKAWQYLEDNGISAGGLSSVIVAVIDTGVDYTHPDLKANMWVNREEIPGNGIDDDENGYIDDVYGVSTTGSTYNHTGDPMDDHGHGTHVAGIIGATNNKEGIVGIAYNVKIMAIKAGQATGVFNQSDIAEAILYAYEMGADVINMSFGGSACSIAVQDALTTAYTTATLVASAGNDGMPNQPTKNYPIPLPNYPAALSYVIGVMSVNAHGVESTFTNWDVISFNSVEYEIYAPGEQIMSTLPDGRYGKLSGTSMAAPIVSAAAALLRSYFSDRDMYPSKFIAAQLCATSQDTAICCDPEDHESHNLPMLLNIEDALKKLPKPDIGVYDFYVFDPVEYNGVEYPENNNDGVADAGETLLIGLVMRNRWGMSRDTIITIDAMGGLGVNNPYVEIIDGIVDFESIGTYSTKSTLIYNEENIITGISDPLIIKLAKNTPNDYLIGLNVYANYYNALDEKDKTEYTYGEPGEYQVSFWARNGVILPSQITEDTVLTKDNYYVIANSVYIHKGVTVTVEPGVQIQFWSDDPNDPYADTYMAYLKVDGKFITNGTAEEPVKLFPSEIMDRYRVEIFPGDNGYVNLNYTTVTNPYVFANKIDHCTFNYNYNSDTLLTRVLSEGRVSTWSGEGKIVSDTTQNSLFYKCGSVFWYYNLELSGEFVGCSFVDSSVVRAQDYTAPTFTNCVFMGNHVRDEQDRTHTSSIYADLLNAYVNTVVRDPQTGTTYIDVYYSAYYGTNASRLSIIREIAQALGGDIACFETPEEWEFIKNQRQSFSNFHIGIDGEDATTWVNGEPIGEYMPVDEILPGSGIGLFYWYSYQDADYNTHREAKLSFTNISGDYLLEIPGSIYLDNITLRENSVKLDDESTYQIFANVIPATFDTKNLIYVSEDESIATVSTTGLVTPVGEGKTRIFVYSPDYQAYDVLTVEIVEKVAVNDVTFEDVVLQLGERVELIPTYAPINTTERGITYTSLDPQIATVNEFGMVTALATGTARIVATAQNGSTDTIWVKIISRVESITFEELFYVTQVGDTDTSWQPIISPATATDYAISYASSNPEIAYVDEAGKLVRVTPGLATIRATVVGTNLCAELNVSVAASDFSQAKIVYIDERDGIAIAVTDDGSLWAWGGSYVKLPIKIADGVKSAVLHNGSWSDGIKHKDITFVNDDGELDRLSYQYELGIAVERYLDYPLSNVAQLYSDGSSYYALKNDGTLWGWGRNGYGQLGLGHVAEVSKPAMMELNNVKDVVLFSDSVAVLTTEGKLYVAGTYNKFALPVCIAENVVAVRGGQQVIVYETTNGSQYQYQYGGDSGLIQDAEDKIVHGFYYNNIHMDLALYVEDGKTYWRGQLVDGVENTVRFFQYGECYYVLTEDGKLYGWGENSQYQMADLTLNQRDASNPNRIFVGIEDDGKAPTLDNSNVVEDILKTPALELSFDRALMRALQYAYIELVDENGNSLPVSKSILLDQLTLTPISPLTNGMTYTLTIPAGAVASVLGHDVEEITLTFTYKNATPIEQESITVKDGDELTDGKLNAQIGYSFALQGEAFPAIALTLNGTPVAGFAAVLKNNVLSLTAQDLAPGTYTLTVPAGALVDQVGGTNKAITYTLTVPAPEEPVYLPLAVAYSSIASRTENVALLPQWRVVMNKAFTLDENLVALVDAEGNSVALNLAVNGNVLAISAKYALAQNTTYTLTVAKGALTDEVGATVEELTATFATVKLSERFFWTVDAFEEEYKQVVIEIAKSPNFIGNAILNNFNETNVELWLRPTTSTGGVNNKVGLAGNWWGTTNEEIIGKQIIDFDDYQSLCDIIYAPYLTEAPSNTFPFVTAAYLLNADGERVKKVSNETVTFVVEFNRDMDTSIPLRVRFGSSKPYAEYEIEGEYVNARRWEGVYTLKTTIENGRQFIRIENGAAADDAYLILCETPGRFGFEIDTIGAQALTMLGDATATGIKLTWMQDDFDTLAGYNVYRSDREDGYYTRLNDYVIPADIKEFFDDTVEPGKRYYYNFTVVKTDLSESTPSGKISIMSMDTMAPDIYHSPVRTAYTGSNLLISATVTDNLALNTVILYYRTVGSTEWKSTQMYANNSRYTGLIPAENVTLEGIEYYIVARDANNVTTKGSADAPYNVTVKLAVDANALGDVDGDGVITNKDALMLLQAANDLLNLTEEQFLRADINGDGELSAAEALRILQYVSGKVTTIV